MSSVPCKWQRKAGIHTGCFPNDRYRKWLPKKELWKCSLKHCSSYQEKEESPKNEPLHQLLMDDALWGFPIGGVLLGVYDSLTSTFAVREIPVKYFQPPLFEQKAYLKAVADAAVELLDELSIDPASARVKVCQGYVNSAIPPALRQKGYRVEVGAIGEPLQSWLESKAAEYVQSLGYNGYYDPKGMSESDIRKAFWRVVRWVEKHRRYDLAKTGWNFWKKRLGKG